MLLLRCCVRRDAVAKALELVFEVRSWGVIALLVISSMK